MADDWVLPALALLALAWGSKGSSPTPPDHPEGVSGEVPVRPTAQGLTRAQWVATRYNAALEALRAQHPELQVGPAGRIARNFVAQQWQEVGPRFLGEHNGNVGNIKSHHSSGRQYPLTPFWEGSWHTLLHRDGSTGRYRAYTTYQRGSADYARLVTSPQYRAAWEWVQAHPDDAAGWADRLLRAEYHPWSQASVDEVARLRRQVDGILEGRTHKPGTEGEDVESTWLGWEQGPEPADIAGARPWWDVWD